MSATPNKHSGPGFSSHTLPGSAAEQEETERLAEFQRQKALRKEEEERNKPARSWQSGRPLTTPKWKRARN